MDLLEIRKKAREKKEAEEKAAAQAADAGQDGGKKPGSGRKPSKRAPSGKAVKPEPAPLQDEAVEAAEAARDVGVESLPDAVPETPDASPEEVVLDDWQPETQVDVPPASPSEAVAGKPGGLSDETGQAALSDEDKDAGPITPDAAQALKGVSEDVLPDDEAAVSDENIVEYLAFMLSDEEYAVKVEEVKEIIRLQKITVVPRAEEFVEGIISLRGVIIPVFDIRKRLGLDNVGRQKSTRIVIVSEGGNPQGIIVDKVTGVARLDADGIEPPPAVIGGVEAEYLDGVGRIGDRILILFDTQKVLSMGVGDED